MGGAGECRWVHTLSAQEGGAHRSLQGIATGGEAGGGGLRLAGVEGPAVAEEERVQWGEMPEGGHVRPPSG